jgi:mono/diheme cytochrome c family protein
MTRFCAALVFVLLIAHSAQAGDATRVSPVDAYAGRGYQLLSTKPYLPPDFTQDVFDELWQTWEEPARSEAAKATLEKRRRMAFSRYGLTSAPGATAGKPQQYIVDAAGNWTMTCLACHQGKVAGKVVAGLPNSLFALQSLADDVRNTKLRMHKQLVRMDLGSALFPLGTTNGTTNAIMFGVVLMANRDAELNVVARIPPKMVHHDHDAPAWWNFKKKTHLYSDGFASKGPRPLMQFMLIPENGPDKFHEWEADFREIYTWLESLEPPAYPFAIDRPLAAKGEAAFAKSCAQCHGTYGAGGAYPNKIVALEDVGTDPVRFEALTKHHRSGYAASWFAHFGDDDTIADTDGYVAPPLDGIWASAPYFHNGSVPTLWHVLHPSERPKVWRRSEDGYDQSKVGLEVETAERLPAGIKTPHQLRSHFDTTKFGKSAAGHLFPDELNEEEKTAVLEYLKTL